MVLFPFSGIVRTNVFIAGGTVVIWCDALIDHRDSGSSVTPRCKVF